MFCKTLVGYIAATGDNLSTTVKCLNYSPVLLQHVMQTTHMRFCPDEIIYTDGRGKGVSGLGIATGSGVYRKLNTAYLKLKVHPYRQGMLNTINRAELVAILVALRSCRPGTKECIATDSMCSMQKIARHLSSPESTINDCHRPLLEAIGQALLQRARNNEETVIVKVKSHIGIHGNEMADQLANEAADECRVRRRTNYLQN